MGYKKQKNFHNFSIFYQRLHPLKNNFENAVFDAQFDNFLNSIFKVQQFQNIQRHDEY